MATDGTGTAAAQHDGEAAGEHDAAGTSEQLVLPYARVKKLIKAQDEVKQVAADAVFAMGRAAELLLQELTKRAAQLVNDADRKTVQYKDVAGAVRVEPPLEFLSDVVPEKMLYAHVRQQLEEEAKQKP